MIALPLRAQAQASHRCDSDTYVPVTARCIATREGTSQDYETTTMVAHSLRADGFDASEDGTGRGTPLVAVAHCDVMPTMMNGANTPAGHNARSGHSKDQYIVPVAFAQNQREEVRELDVAGAISSIRRGDAKNETLLAETLRQHPRPSSNSLGAIAFGWQNSSQQGASVTPTLDKSKVPGIGHAMQVRRLTPRECERLQGFPDDYTLVPIGKRRKPAKDGPRYKALGNSMAVPVVRWIGERIDMVEQLTAHQLTEVTA